MRRAAVAAAARLCAASPRHDAVPSVAVLRSFRASPACDAATPDALRAAEPGQLATPQVRSLFASALLLCQGMLTRLPRLRTPAGAAAADAAALLQLHGRRAAQRRARLELAQHRCRKSACD
jgi:hypothetical protein